MIVIILILRTIPFIQHSAYQSINSTFLDPQLHAGLLFKEFKTHVTSLALKTTAML